MKEKIDVKIGTPMEVIWTTMLKGTVDTIERMKKELIINDAIVELCKEKIKAEKDKV